MEGKQPIESKRSRFNELRGFLKGIRQRIKDDYMLILFESKQGSFDNLKKANSSFDRVFMSIQMRIIIWLVVIALSIVMFFYMRYQGVHVLVSMPISLLLMFLVKKSLDLMAYALILKKKEEER